MAPRVYVILHIDVSVCFMTHVQPPLIPPSLNMPPDNTVPYGIIQYFEIYMQSYCGLTAGARESVTTVAL